MKKGSAGGGRDPKVGENKDRSGDRPPVHEGASAAVSIKSVSKTLSDTVSGGSKEAAHGPTRTAIFVELEKTGRTLEREAKRVKNWGARRTRRMQPEPGRDGKAGGCLRKMRKFSKRDDWLLLGWEARHGDLGGAVNLRGCALLRREASVNGRFRRTFAEANFGLPAILSINFPSISILFLGLPDAFPLRVRIVVGFIAGPPAPPPVTHCL